jgi:tetratricopeptide (TPR) repeat protein
MKPFRKHLSCFFFAAAKRSFVLAGLLILLSAGCIASPQDAWQKGNAFYQQKNYDSAAYYFEQLAASKPADAGLYYNLGNTYYRLNKVGLAVLNYERALKRKPAYKEASENLLLARSRIPGSIKNEPEDIFFVRWWKSLTAPPMIMLWSVLSLLFFIGLIGLLLYRRLKRGAVYIRPQIVGVLTLLWLGSLLLAFSAAYATLSNINGVIVNSNATFTPKENGAGVLIPEGTTVHIRAQQGNRYEVSLPDGRDGYVPAIAVQVVD